MNKSIMQKKRKELEITQKEIADALGVSEYTVSRWESFKEKRESMSVSSALKLSQILKLDIETLIK